MFEFLVSSSISISNIVNSFYFLFFIKISLMFLVFGIFRFFSFVFFFVLKLIIELQQIPNTA